MSRLAGVCLAAVLPVAIAGCGAASVSGGEPVVPDPVTPQGTSVDTTRPAPDLMAAYYELPQGTVRVTGVVFSAGEDMLPRRPFRSGAIVAMTRERYDRFRVNARGPWKSALINGRDFPMPGRLIADPEVHRSDLDAGGTYSLTLAPGDYVLCLGSLSEVEGDSEPGEDLWIDKVFETVVTDEDLQTIIPVIDRASGELVLHH